LKSKKVGAARLVGRSRPTKSQLEKQAKLIEEKKQKLKCRDKVDLKTFIIRSIIIK
jgi:hypothetical protein